MKKIFYLLFLVLVVFGFELKSQSVTDEEITYKYKKLPANPVPKSVKSYEPNIIMTYEDEDRRKLEEYNAKSIEADSTYKKSLAEYKNTSFGDKFAAKLIGQDDGKPVKEFIEKPYTRKIYDKELIASQMKFEGYDKANPGDIKITYTIHGIEYTDYKMNESGSISTDKKKYSISFKYRSPISIKVETEDGRLIINEVVPATNEYKNYSGSSYESQSLASEKSGPLAFLSTVDQKMVDDNIKLANLYLSDRCGFTNTTRKTRLYSVKSKKDMDFTDYQNAYLSAMEGYFLLVDNLEEGLNKIKSSIKIWEESIKDFKIGDNSTRINDEVFVATVFNLAEAYVTINEYSKAKLIIAKAKTMDLSKKEMKRMEEIKTFSDQQQERYEANNSTE